MPTKTVKKTSEMSESQMFASLCQKHGYTFMANKPGKRVSMMFSSKERTLTAYYLMQLAVPMDSKLAKQMIEQYPVKTEKKPR